MACFSLRDIDFCKIESRPTSVQLLQSLQLKRFNDATTTSTTTSSSSSPTPTSTNPVTARTSQPTYANANNNNNTNNNAELPRFQYIFYLDFLASELDDRTQNALAHLREQSQFVRVLGSYPRGGTGPKAG